MNKKAMIGLGILTGATMMSIIASAIKNNKIFKTNMSYADDKIAQAELMLKDYEEKEKELEERELKLEEREAQVAQAKVKEVEELLAVEK